MIIIIITKGLFFLYFINLLKSLTADIAQDNLAIDALRTQVILK